MRKVRLMAIEAGTSNTYVNNIAGIFTKRARDYIIVFLFCNSFGIANRVQNAVDPDNTILWLTICQGAFFPLHGLLNGIIFGYNNYRTIHRVMTKKVNKNQNSSMSDVSDVSKYSLIQNNKDYAIKSSNSYESDEENTAENF